MSNAQPTIYDFLTPKEKRRLAIYAVITELHQKLITEYPECKAPVPTVYRTISENAAYARFRATYPDYPKTIQGIKNIIQGKTQVQQKSLQWQAQHPQTPQTDEHRN